MKDKFSFESYGVRVSIGSNSEAILKKAIQTARTALLNNIRPIDDRDAEHDLHLELNDSGVCSYIQDGKSMTAGEPNHGFWTFFDSLVRVFIAEQAKSVVFLHSGAVAWKGKAIIVPGNSYSGKSTLVAEMIKRGAEYYSDEYAIIDESGLLQPFARPLTLRNSSGSIIETSVRVQDLGGTEASANCPIGAVLITKYDAGASWEPRRLSLGQGLMELLPQTIAIRRNTQFAVKILKKAIENAIIVKSQRSEAALFARYFLEFVDNTAF